MASVKKQNFLEGQFYTSIVLVVLIGISLFTTYRIQVHIHGQRRTTITQVKNFDTFWLSLAGKAEPNSNQSWAKLETDVKPLLSDLDLSAVPQTRLLPHKITDINVAQGTYPGLDNQLGIFVFDSPDIRVCIDCGPFKSWFIQDLNLVKAGQVESIIQPVPVLNTTKFYFVPGSFSVLEYGIALYMLIWLLGIGIGFGCAAGITYDGPIDMSVLEWETLGIMAMNWPYYLPRNILKAPWLWKNSKGHKSKLAAKQAVQDRLEAHLAEERRNANNPVKDELIAARSRLDTLAALPVTVQKTGSVKKAIKDTTELIKELSDFPNQLSDRAAELLAQEMLRKNIAARDKPKALLDATEEVESL